MSVGLSSPCPAVEDDEFDQVTDLKLVGAAPVFREAIERIRRIAGCQATTLIEGETGTGKELAARAIHYLGQRRSAPFIPVNCGAIPESLFENELFGHARGAYTNAGEATSGVIGDAEGGTLFLDEIEALPLRSQASLLCFIQEGIYRPLGSRQTVRGDTRIIAATNAGLRELAAHGAFRWDLLHRLRIMTLELPALRARPGDAVLLARHFIRRFARQYDRPEKTLDDESIRVLSSYTWPGNVRELENLIHRELLLGDGPALRIRPADLLEAPGDTQSPAASEPYSFGFAAAKTQAIAQFERSYLHWALARSQGNVSLAARLCGKERRTFGKLLKKHGISREQFAV